MGKKLDHYGYTRDERVKVLNARINEITEGMTVENNEESLRKIGCLQVKIAGLTQANNNVIDWGIQILK